MKKTREKKGEKNNFIVTTIFMVLIITFVLNSTSLMKKSTDMFVVADGSLYYEELTEGYVIRDEIVLQGETYKNGMVKVVSDGERVAKNQVVFRHHSNSENLIVNQIDEIDEEINEIIENNVDPFVSSDISSLNLQIEETLDSIRNINYLQTIYENKNEIDAYISKKAKITGQLSPEDSNLKQLTNKRNELEKELENGAEIIRAPRPGSASYRVDGLEETLKVDNFDYLTTELLSSFDLKVGASIPFSNEKGKVVDNFKCYIATSINTEKAMTANVGDNVTLRLSTAEEIDAKIIYIKEENDNRILVFEIKEHVSDLLEYRKISFDIIWWKYKGWKVSNSCVLDMTKGENDINYVEKERAGFIDKVPIKVLRQNENYSIVKNYEKEELRELGYTEEEISEMLEIKLNLYDEIIQH